MVQIKYTRDIMSDSPLLLFLLALTKLNLADAIWSSIKHLV